MTVYWPGIPARLPSLEAPDETAGAPVEQPRVCMLGPMVGRRPGFVICQGLVVARLLEADGYVVVARSSRINRYARFADILLTLVQHRDAFDVVCLEVYGGPSFIVEDAASRVARLLRKPLIMTLHGGAMPEFMARFPRWARAVLRRADCLVAPSKFLGQAATDHGLDARILPNVVDLDRYCFRHRRTLHARLFWMRAFHPIYNPQLAVRVLARVRREVPEATLVMAGQQKGAERETEELTRTLGVEDAVRFAGFLDADGKRREGDAADIFINTNRVDNTPVAVLEAAAMGLPIVATSVGGIPALLEHERDALLVADDDEEGMAAAILRLLRDPDLASRLSRNGRLLAERSGWQAVGAAWKAMLRDVAARATHSAADRRGTVGAG